MTQSWNVRKKRLPWLLFFSGVFTLQVLQSIKRMSRVFMGYQVVWMWWNSGWFYVHIRRLNVGTSTCSNLPVQICILNMSLAEQLAKIPPHDHQRLCVSCTQTLQTYVKGYQHWGGLRGHRHIHGVSWVCQECSVALAFQLPILMVRPPSQTWC